MIVKPSRYLKWQRYLRLSILGLKQVGKIVCVGMKTSNKNDLYRIETRRMSELEYKSCRAKTVYPGIEAGKKYCLCSVSYKTHNHPKPAKTTNSQPKPPTTSHNHPKQAKTRRSHPKLITNTQSHSKSSITEHYCQKNPQPPTTT